MIKYLLYILFGIILYLIFNNMDTLTISSKNIGERCDPIEEELQDDPCNNYDDNTDLSINNTCNYPRGKNTCTCIDLSTDQNQDNRCKLDSELVKIKIPAKKISDSCIANNNCVLQANYDTQHVDVCYNSCRRGEQDCENHHADMDNCRQHCNLELVVDSSDKNLNNSGFVKISNFLKPEDQHTQIMVQDLQNSENDISDYNDLTFSEYIFRSYLEKQNTNFCMRKIKNGIYYINNKLYLAYSDRNNSRRVVMGRVQMQARADGERLDRISEGILASTRYTWAYPELHTDTQNIVKWRQKDGDPLSECNQRATGIIGKKDYTLQDYNRDVLERWDKWGLEYILSGYNTKLINIWILLHGTPGVKTLGFMDFIDESNPDLYRSEDGTYKKLLVNQNDPEKLTPFFYGLKGFPYIHNIDNSNAPQYTEPRTIYSYNMNITDAYVFNSDIPHIGFDGSFNSSDNYYRTSIEIRYEYIDFDVSMINFNITYDMRLTTCAAGWHPPRRVLSIDQLSNSQMWELYNIDPVITWELGAARFPGSLGPRLDRDYIDYVRIVYREIASAYNEIWIKNYYRTSWSLRFYPSIYLWNILNLKTSFDDVDIVLDEYGRFNDPRVCKKFLDTIQYDVLHGDILSMTYPTDERDLLQLKRIITDFLTQP